MAVPEIIFWNNSWRCIYFTECLSYVTVTVSCYSTICQMDIWSYDKYVFYLCLRFLYSANDIVFARDAEHLKRCITQKITFRSE